MNGLEALDYLLDEQDKLEKYGTSGTISVSKQRECLNAIEKELKALDILTKSLALEMSVDEDYAVLSVKISKDKLCIVGSVKGKENIEPLKAVMKYYEEAPQFTDLDMEKLIKELLKGEVFKVNE